MEMGDASPVFPFADEHGDSAMSRRQPDCVGALIRNGQNRVYLQRRSQLRRQLPGAWDIVGGHIEPHETPETALAREVSEETGWRLRRIEAVIADWEWTHNGVVRRELDYLIEVDGDLSSPRLEPGKHDKFCWVGYDNPESVRSEYDAGNDALWNIIRRAARIRLTSDVRLEPISGSSANILHWLYRNGAVKLDDRAVQEEELPVIAADPGCLWDAGRGYGWLAYWRKGRGPAIGYGGLARRRIRGADQLVLQCAVLPNERRMDCAEAIVKAMLAFARNEIGADQVSAYVSPSNRWAVEIMDSAGMRNSGPIESGSLHAHEFSVNLHAAPPIPVDQEVIVTGIGQILAVPS
jgi:8-oxo-dGTP pyrophosphatase MutT (NUDIX family)